MNANARGAVLALLAFAVYSTHDVVVKTLGASYSPLQIVFFANLFGFPVVTVMMMRDRAEGNLRPKHPWWTTLRVAAALVSTTLAFYAFSQLPMAQTYALIFAAPLLITMLSVPVLGETVGWRRSLAVAVGLVGVLVVLRPGATELTTGHAAALGAAVCSAIGAIVMRKIGQDERSAVMLLYPMMANFLVMACLLGFVYQPMPVIHLGGTGLMAVLGFVGGLCIIGAYREGRAVIVAPMQVLADPLGGSLRLRLLRRGAGPGHGARGGDHHPERRLHRAAGGQGRRVEDPAGAADPDPGGRGHLPAGGVDPAPVPEAAARGRGGRSRRRGSRGRDASRRGGRARAEKRRCTATGTALNTRPVSECSAAW